jgi:hypothetical protein
MKKLLISTGISVVLLNATNIELMFSTVNFDSTTYQNSKKINNENGDLAGVNFSLSQYLKRNKLTLNTEYNKGLVNNGSNSKNKLLLDNYSLTFGVPIFNDKTVLGNGNIYFNTGIGYSWNRLKSDNTDYEEKYKWGYYLMGLSLNENFESFDFDITSFYHRAVSPKLHVKSGKYGNTYDLKTTDGYRIEVPIRYHIQQNFGVMLKYVYDYWEINVNNSYNIKVKNQYINAGFYYNF